MCHCTRAECNRSPALRRCSHARRLITIHSVSYCPRHSAMADVELAAPGPPPALPPRPSDSNSREPSTNAPPTVLQRHHSVDPNGTQQTPYNPSSQSQLDLYAADRARSPCAYVWYRWFNPWVRWLTILVVLYLYALSSGVLTYRGNTFQVGGAVRASSAQHTADRHGAWSCLLLLLLLPLLLRADIPPLLSNHWSAHRSHSSVL